MADTRFWQEQFELRANLPTTWRLVADDLLVAADVLAPEYRAALESLHCRGIVLKASQLSRPIHLLRAAAVEALLKGRAVRQGRRFVVQGEFRPIGFAPVFPKPRVGAMMISEVPIVQKNVNAGVQARFGTIGRRAATLL